MNIQDSFDKEERGNKSEEFKEVNVTGLRNLVM